MAYADSESCVKSAAWVEGKREQDDSGPRRMRSRHGTERRRVRWRWRGRGRSSTDSARAEYSARDCPGREPADDLRDPRLDTGDPVHLDSDRPEIAAC